MLENVKINTHYVHYEHRRIDPNKSTLVFINSLGTDHRVWSYVLAELGQNFNVLKSKKIDNNTIEILSQNEKISLNFNENIDLASQKIRISQKIENLNKQINALDNKLKNKAYVKNAPKEIVQNDKKLLKELTVEDSKLRSIVSSIN